MLCALQTQEKVRWMRTSTRTAATLRLPRWLASWLPSRSLGFICNNPTRSPCYVTRSTTTLRIFKSNQIKWGAHTGLFVFKFGAWVLTFSSGLWTCKLPHFQLVFGFSNSEIFRFHSLATMLPVPHMQIVQGMWGLAVAASVKEGWELVCASLRRHTVARTVADVGGTWSIGTNDLMLSVLTRHYGYLK